ncbi:flagellar basal body-associated FliL family protein [Paracoccus methylovorus]|uniref:Flagellar protein FliL n=1 Tax=Paracoccus methylovorus TaxID=2812658 RepID=A0ABX7JHN9_9RHOB|nr:MULTISPECIES: flagellar basal body-associated FliL family protein [Paracoccus]QRZ13229.1 flagellar basal body-associated FliL family protein [Paracoccus methylovorus]
MTDIANMNTKEKSGVGRILLPLGLGLILGVGGFTSTYLGFWSPLSFFVLQGEKIGDSTASVIDFVDVPQIVLTLAGPNPRILVMSIKIETDRSHRAAIEYLTPRLLDSFNGFLADIDSTAFEKRGILDIIRDELATCAIFVLGKEAFTDILITEFRIQ